MDGFDTAQIELLSSLALYQERSNNLVCFYDEHWGFIQYSDDYHPKAALVGALYDCNLFIPIMVIDNFALTKDKSFRLFVHDAAILLSSHQQHHRLNHMTEDNYSIYIHHHVQLSIITGAHCSCLPCNEHGSIYE